MYCLSAGLNFNYITKPMHEILKYFMCYWVYFTSVLLYLSRIRVSHLFKGALFIVIENQPIIYLFTKQSDLCHLEGVDSSLVLRNKSLSTCGKRCGAISRFKILQRNKERFLRVKFFKGWT